MLCVAKGKENMSQITMFQIDEKSPHIDELVSLFSSEWSDFKVRDLGISNPEIPMPIVVLLGERLVGGLAFSLFEEPGCLHKVVWLNAVYICRDFRRQGIARNLIQFAQTQLKDSQFWLYAYTDVPALYEALGWSEVDTEVEANHKVMRVSLVSQSHQ